MQLELSDRAARRLSRELRWGHHPHLARRRRLLALELAASGSMGLIALYQMGLLKQLPEPPLPYLDADKVDASAEAYRKLAMPDAALGFLSYAVTITLVAAGGARRARERPWLPLALAAKLGLDAVQAGKLSVHQWTRHRAFCFWCLIAAGTTFAALPLAWPEARDVWRRLTTEIEPAG